jgi:hypothetical protein
MKYVNGLNRPCDHAFGITVDGIDQCAECRMVFPIIEAMPPSLRDEIAMIRFPWVSALGAVALFVVVLVILIGGQS